MKKSFTLIELLVVIIIVGILATLGITQYSGMVERSRGAEAKAILGGIRQAAQAHYAQYRQLSPNAATGIPDFCQSNTNNFANIGNQLTNIPNACRSSHLFRYSCTWRGYDWIVIQAIRCGSTGKPPSGGAYINRYLNLHVNLTSGFDRWTTSGPWQ